VQAAALDWLIADTRGDIPTETPVERQAIAELLGTDAR